MRALQRFSIISSPCARLTVVRCVAQQPQPEDLPQPSRSSVLARWAGSNSGAFRRKQPEKGLLGKGLSFASGFLRDVSPSSRRTATNATPDFTVGDVPWDLCERMDYHVQYNVPSAWQVSQLLRDNSIAIQCSPPPSPDRAPDEGAVHGISLNCFAYKQRVKQPDSRRLLHVFLQRFNASVNNSLEVIAEGQPPARKVEVKLPNKGEASATGTGTAAPDPVVDLPSVPYGSGETAQLLAKQLSSAVAEISFTPAAGQPIARGLCRAFYNSNGRFHYVIVAAVPEEEYGTSLDLIVHAVASVVESRVEAAAKRT